MIKNIIKYMLKHFVPLRVRKGLFDLYKKDNLLNSPGYGSEVFDVPCRPSNSPSRRLNILIPALSERFVFGGIYTALVFFHAYAQKFDSARIVLVSERGYKTGKNKKYRSWKVVGDSEPDVPGFSIYSFSDRSRMNLPVGPNETWIATIWWSAHLACKIREFVQETFGSSSSKYIYFIQDFEPGFYSWSTSYLEAHQSYTLFKDDIAVVNSQFLCEYFKNKGYTFRRMIPFDPVLNLELRKYLSLLEKTSKKNIILVYGRPSTPRNCFGLIAQSLQLATGRKNCKNWEFISVGEKHENLVLGQGSVLRSLGKLTIEEYANVLIKSSIGISLMASPHPSYPPLEMAAFKVKVITNDFENKNLQLVYPNITSIHDFSPEAIADTLILLMEKQESMSFEHEEENNPLLEAFINRGNDFTEVIRELEMNI